jgi:Pyridoxamine 5'-phosphate oxidase
MSTLAEIAPPFVDLAHRIVWATVATVDPQNRPRTRILHPVWEWDGTRLTGWIATGPTPVKVAHLEHTPNVSLTYWDPSHDTCTAECSAEWVDDDGKVEVWERFENAPSPVGYDPGIVQAWAGGPTSPAFAALRLAPWRLRVSPGTVLLEGKGDVLSWSQ